MQLYIRHLQYYSQGWWMGGVIFLMGNQVSFFFFFKLLLYHITAANYGVSVERLVHWTWLSVNLSYWQSSCSWFFSIPYHCSQVLSCSVEGLLHQKPNWVWTTRILGAIGNSPWLLRLSLRVVYSQQMVNIFVVQCNRQEQLVLHARCYVSAPLKGLITKINMFLSCE